MSSVVINGDTSGSITLQAPAIAGTNTLTLPASTGTVALLQTPSFATTIGVGGATPSSSGSGITFPTSQSASSDANTLDDYEEGTWTPTLNISGLTTGITYSHRQGYYTKVGRLVTVSCTILLTNKGSNTGVVNITGLPFTAFDTSVTGRTTGSIYVGSMSGLSGYTVQALFLSDISNRLDMNWFNGTTDGNLTGANLTNSSYIVISVSYLTA